MQTAVVYILKWISIWISPRDYSEKTLSFPDLKLQSIQFDFDSSDTI